MTPRRPFSVTLLIWLVLSLSVWGALRLTAALRWWNELYEFGSHLPPPYLAVTGAGWLLGGCVLIWGAWGRRAWVRIGFLVLMGLCLASYWLERLFFQSARPNLSFVLAASAVLILVVGIITFHGSTVTFLRKSEEYEQSDEVRPTA